MIQLKEKKINPSEKHKKSHCFIVYKKTLDNVVKSLEKNTITAKKIQQVKEVENVYFDMKINHNLEKQHQFHSNNALHEKKEKNHLLIKNPFQSIDKSERTRSHSHKRCHDLFLFKHNNKDQNKESPVNKASTKNSSSEEYETELIKELKKENNFYKYKCFESEQKLNFLEKRLHEEEKTHRQEKESYEEKIKNLVRSPENNEKELYKSVTFKHTLQGKRSNEDIEHDHLHRQEFKHGKNETQRHSQSIQSEHLIGKKVVC